MHGNQMKLIVKYKQEIHNLEIYPKEAVCLSDHDGIKIAILALLENGTLEVTISEEMFEAAWSNKK
jgi:hypothetical protein